MPDPTVALPHREELGVAFERALLPLRTDDAPLGLLFSGGIDSTLLAWELRRRPALTLYTIGTEGSADLRAAEVAASRLDMAWIPLLIASEDVASSEERHRATLTDLGPVARTVLLSIATAIDRAPVRRLVCGQGADELFLGYAHYRGLAPADAERRSLADLDRLRTIDWPKTQLLADRAQKVLSAPYLESGFVRASLSIPIDERLPHDEPKRMLRRWAVERGVPPELASRPKKALQYGSGVDAIVRSRRARRS